MTRLQRDDRPPLPPRGTPVTWYLDQEHWWRGQDGRPYRLDRMDPEHRVNLRAFLARHATRLREHARWVELSVAGADDALGDQLVDQLTGLLDAASDAAWLADRPLVRALDRLIARQDALDGEVVPNAPELAARHQLEGADDDERNRLEG